MTKEGGSEAFVSCQIFILSQRGLTAEKVISVFRNALQVHPNSDEEGSKVLDLVFCDLFGTHRTDGLAEMWPVVDYLQRIAGEEPITTIVDQSLRPESFEGQPRMVKLVSSLRDKLQEVESRIGFRRSDLLAVHTDMRVIEGNLRQHFVQRQQEIIVYYQERIDRTEIEEERKTWKAEIIRQTALVNPQEFVYPTSLEETESPTTRLLQRLSESTPDDQVNILKALQNEVDVPSHLYIGRTLWSLLLCQQAGNQGMSDLTQVAETDLMSAVSKDLAWMTRSDKARSVDVCQERCPNVEQAVAYARGMTCYLDGLLLTRADRNERTLLLADAVNDALQELDEKKAMAATAKDIQIAEATGIEKPDEEDNPAHRLLWSLGERQVDGGLSLKPDDWDSVRTQVASIGESDRILFPETIQNLEAIAAFLIQARENQEIVFALEPSGRFTRLEPDAETPQGTLCLVATVEDSGFVVTRNGQERLREEREVEKKNRETERREAARREAGERAFSAWQQLLSSQRETLDDFETVGARIFLICGKDGLNQKEVRQQLETVLADKGQVYVVGKDPASVVPPGEPRQLRLVQVVEAQRLTRGLKIELKDMAGKTLASMTLRDFVVHNNGLIFLDGDQVANLSELRIQRAQGRQQAQAEQALAQQKIAQAEAENILFTQAEVLDNQGRPAGSLLKQVLAIEGRRIAVGQEALIEIQQVLSAGGRVWGGELIGIRQSRVFQVLEVKDIRDDRILVCRIVGDESAGEVTRRVTEFKGFVLLDKERTGQLEQQTSAGDRSQTAVAEAAVPRVVVEPERDKARVGAAASAAVEQNWQLLRDEIERKWKTGIGIAGRDLLGQVNAEEDLIIKGARVNAEFASIQNKEVIILTKDGARKVRVAQKNYRDFLNVYGVSDEKKILAIVIPGGANKE